jgi:hypothetical protein
MHSEVGRETRREETTRCRWGDNIRMDLKEVVCEVVDWIHLGPVAGCCVHGNMPSGSIKGGESLDYLSD